MADPVDSNSQREEAVISLNFPFEEETLRSLLSTGWFQE
jgi:hypothetical protein